MKSPKLKPLHQPGDAGGAEKKAPKAERAASPKASSPKAVLPGVMPAPDPANCPACRGRHVAHTCGRSKDALAKSGISPSTSMYKDSMSPTGKGSPSPKPAAKAKSAAVKPKAAANPAPKRKAVELDDDDGEEHLTVRLVIGNTAKFLREEEGKKFYEWTVYARTEPMYDSSSDEDSDEENEDDDKAKGVNSGSGAAAAVKDEAGAPRSEQPAAAASGDALTAAATASADATKPAEAGGDAAAAEAGGDAADAASAGESKPATDAAAAVASSDAAKADPAKAERVKKREEQRKSADLLAKKFITKTEFVLHESFRPPIAKRHAAPFEVTHEGWGIFVLPVLVETSGKRPFRVSHVLAFNKAQTQKSYTIDAVTGKLWRPKKTIVVEPRSRPARERVAAKPKALEDFVDNNAEAVRAVRMEKERLAAEEKRRKEQLRLEKEAEEEEEEDGGDDDDSDGDGDESETEDNTSGRGSKSRKYKREELEDYATWKRQVKYKSEGSAPMVSPQWLQHFQQQGGGGASSHHPSFNRTSSDPRRAVSSFTRASTAPIKGFNDLDALYYMWPKMHKAISLAMERLPPKGNSTQLKVARYFLIQYKRAQEQPALAVAGVGSAQTTVKDSPANAHANGGDDKPAAAAQEAEEEAVEKYPAGWLSAYQKLDLPSIKTLAMVDVSRETKPSEPAEETDTSKEDCSRATTLTADDANALDNTAASPAAPGKRSGVSAFPLKLEDPEATLVKHGWTTDEAEVVET